MKSGSFMVTSDRGCNPPLQTSFFPTWNLTPEQHLQVGCQLDGCQPAKSQRRRARTNIGRLSCNATTVARPVGVKPRISVWSAFHSKCTCQSCLLRSNSGAGSPVWGSVACVCVALNSLHGRQANHRLFRVVRPPLATGTRWSRVRGIPLNASSVRQ